MTVRQKMIGNSHATLKLDKELQGAFEASIKDKAMLNRANVYESPNGCKITGVRTHLVTYQWENESWQEEDESITEMMAFVGKKGEDSVEGRGPLLAFCRVGQYQEENYENIGSCYELGLFVEPTIIDVEKEQEIKAQAIQDNAIRLIREQVVNSALSDESVDVKNPNSLREAITYYLNEALDTLGSQVQNEVETTLAEVIGAQSLSSDPPRGG